ncbi:hypothetical protein M9Y10_044413 [Tritrichomonas musculus]|uniref:Uncharacterized protein n=1 Tax=Tritrichomonas musculus TaxID=1915356 RepID=A0ABR2JU59_9EUKA
MLNNKKKLLIKNNINQNIQILEQKKFLNNKTYNVIKDLLNNLTLSPNARSYSDESKLFYLCLFEKPAEAYHWLEKAFPIPCETNLRKTFTNLIKETEVDLLSLDNLPKIISKLNIKETVDAVLSVDAF